MHSIEYRLIIARLLPSTSTIVGGRILGTVNEPVSTTHFSKTLVIVIIDINTNSREPQFNLSYNAIDIEVISVINLLA